MKATGVVVEHNPFHNGHSYHVQQALEVTGADVVIAVMSGNFLQRGEPALVDKWTRAEMSLSSGVDLVIELPYRYATASAKEFAQGAIHLLDHLKCETFVFGSEHGRVEDFLTTHSLIHSNQQRYNLQIKESLSSGKSYPMALQDAFQSLNPDSAKSVDLSLPNNILGFHYVEAAYDKTIQPLTIQRIGAGYHDFIEEGQAIASATGIRHSLFETLTIPGEHVPVTTYRLLQNWNEEYQQFASWEEFWPTLRYAILSKTPEQLKQHAEVTEGIEHAIHKHAKSSTSYTQFMHNLKSKRYTWTRLQRMVTHIYTGFLETQRSREMPDAIRLLGMTKAGQAYLNQYKKDFLLPLVSRLASSDSPFLAHDSRSSDLYYLGFSSAKLHDLVGTEHKKLPLRI
ncbi:nucleotidyltransferase [Chryseomicrobium sp. FSL W7-1435]|uniref:nucleotidyltransferase n=1 Tax=Chryseomicrobium sp. FSL W7-1435 TaxID=2921704 RepID=UPI003159DE77